MAQVPWSWPTVLSWTISCINLAQPILLCCDDLDCDYSVTHVSLQSRGAVEVTNSILAHCPLTASCTVGWPTCTQGCCSAAHLTFSCGQPCSGWRGRRVWLISSPTQMTNRTGLSQLMDKQQLCQMKAQLQASLLSCMRQDCHPTAAVECLCCYVPSSVCYSLLHPMCPSDQCLVQVHVRHGC